MSQSLRSWLSHPLTAGLDLDDPRTTEQRRALIESKPFLKAIYREWYTRIAAGVPDGMAPALEIGSGAGFLSDYVPRLITSEILPTRTVRLVCDATRLPLGDATLRAIVMTNVLHHIPRVREFFREAARCVQPGGAMVMLEPWVSTWSRVVYTTLHAEPFQPDRKSWDFESTGPLSGANGAIPWMLFERDAAEFARECPDWRIAEVAPGMPFRYLVSGGVSLRSLVPNATFPWFTWIERRFEPWMARWAMFAHIRLVRR